MPKPSKKRHKKEQMAYVAGSSMKSNRPNTIIDTPSHMQPSISTYLPPLVFNKWANMGAKTNIETE